MRADSTDLTKTGQGRHQTRKKAALTESNDTWQAAPLTAAVATEVTVKNSGANENLWRGS